MQTGAWSSSIIRLFCLLGIMAMVSPPTEAQDLNATEKAKVREENTRVQAAVQKEIRELLAEAEEIELLSLMQGADLIRTVFDILEQKKETADIPRMLSPQIKKSMFRGYHYHGRMLVRNEQKIQKLLEVLFQSVDLESDRSSACIQAGYAIRIAGDKRSLDMVIDYRCLRIMFYFFQNDKPANKTEVLMLKRNANNGEGCDDSAFRKLVQELGLPMPKPPKKRRKMELLPEARAVETK